MNLVKDAVLMKSPSLHFVGFFFGMKYTCGATAKLKPFI